MTNREVYQVLKTLSTEELDQEFLILDYDPQQYGKPVLRPVEEAKSIIRDHLFDGYALEKSIDINSIIEALQSLDKDKRFITEDDLYRILDGLNFSLNGLEITKDTIAFIIGGQRVG